MTQYSLFPSYVQIFYHSTWAPHVMTIPTRQWSAGDDQGNFLGWDEGTHPADNMIQTFVTAWADLFTSEVVFDYYAIFNYADEESLAVPVAFNDLSTPGTVSPSGITNKAVQITISWQCAGGFLLKTVGLDANSGVDFEKIGPIDIMTFLPDVVTEITAVTNGWASRAGTQPLFPKQAAYTLNEKLRRSYHEN